MYKQNGIRLCGDAADVGEADVAGDPFGAEFVEIAGENPYADHNLLIRGGEDIRIPPWRRGVSHGGSAHAL